MLAWIFSFVIVTVVSLTMVNFDPVEFVSNPSVEDLDSDNITKDDLKYIATIFRIPFTHSTTKDELKANIDAYLRATDPPIRHNISLPDPQATLEIENVKLQTMQLKLQSEFAERETARLRIEQERETARLRIEEEEIIHERRIQEAREQREHELQVLQLKQSTTVTESPVKFDVAKHVKLLPTFTEKNPDAFFRQFETTAEHFEWPKEHWVWLLKPKLVGKSIDVYDGVHDNTNYEEVKKAILAAYSITTEGYRQAFRNLTKNQTQTYSEFAGEKFRSISGFNRLT